MKNLLNQSRHLLILGAIIFLASCAQNHYYADNYNQLPKDDKLRQIVDMQDRLDRVAGTLLIHNAKFCRNKVRNLFGFAATNKYSYSATMSSTAAQVFGLGEQLQITHVTAGSGAERVGLQPGDILLTIENQPVPQGPTAESKAVEMLSPIVAKKSSVKMSVSRNGTVYSFDIPLTLACGFRVELGHTDDVSAYSDGQRILVTRGMMRFASSDNELSYVISKEMAHNVLNHANALRTTDAAKKVIDNLIQVNPRNAVGLSRSIKPMTRQYDLHSDTLGLAMALQAGYEIDSAVYFWTRLAQTYPAPHSYSSLHPAARSRIEKMPQAISRIKAADEKRKVLSH